MRKSAFTLIELLVVVLIISILASIAVGKYTRAIQKAKAVNALEMVRSVVEAERRYYTAQGKYTERLSELDLDFRDAVKKATPTLGLNTVGNNDAVRTFGNSFDIMIPYGNYAGGFNAVTASIISGPYTGAEFTYFLDSKDFRAAGMPDNTPLCMEPNVNFKNKGRDGDFCVRVMNYSFAAETSSWARKFYIQK